MDDVRRKELRDELEAVAAALLGANPSAAAKAAAGDAQDPSVWSIVQTNTMHWLRR